MSEKLRVDIRGVGESRWSSNGLEFETEEEAVTYANNLLDRWFGADGFRVVPVSTPSGQPIIPSEVRQH